MRVVLPAVLDIDRHVHGQWLRRVARPAHPLEATAACFSHARLQGVVLLLAVEGEPEVLLVFKRASHYAGRTHVALTAPVDPTADTLDLAGPTWLGHPRLHGEPPSLEAIHGSWVDAVRFRADTSEARRVGFRRPKLGALHAILAHRDVS